jgi:hypothetical protein
VYFCAKCFENTRYNIKYVECKGTLSRENVYCVSCPVQFILNIFSLYRVFLTLSTFTQSGSELRVFYIILPPWFPFASRLIATWWHLGLVLLDLPPLHGLAHVSVSSCTKKCTSMSAKTVVGSRWWRLGFGMIGQRAWVAVGVLREEKGAEEGFHLLASYESRNMRQKIDAPVLFIDFFCITLLASAATFPLFLGGVDYF